MVDIIFKFGKSWNRFRYNRCQTCIRAKQIVWAMGEEQNQSLNFTFNFDVKVTLGNVVVKYPKGRTVNTIGNPENIEYKSKYKFKY